MTIEKALTARALARGSKSSRVATSSRQCRCAIESRPGFADAVREARAVRPRRADDDEGDVARCSGVEIKN